MKDQMAVNNQMSMGQPLPPVMNNQNSQMFVQPGGGGSMMTSTHRGGGAYGMWPPSQNQTSGVPMMGPRSNKNSWKNKKGLNDKWNSNKTMIGGNSNSNSSGGYNPPTLNELQQQNRLKARRYFPKKKFNHGGGRSAPFAPRNTTSFLIRAKKAGGITSLVSPCPVTPAVLPTPIFSPSREVLVDMAKEEWGVDGYGSMKGLIRLRSPGNGNEGEEDEEEEEGGSSESDVEEHVEVERRLDHDLSRFEMIYPNYSGVDHTSYNLENRVDDQDTHIAQLEEENLILKERLFLMEREFDDLRMRLQCLERQSRGVTERVNNEEVVENDSENESESRGFGRFMEDNNDVMQENIERSQNSEDDNNNGDVEFKQSDSTIEKGMQEIEVGINKDVNVTTDVCMEEDYSHKTEDVETNKENNNEATAEDDDQKHVVGFSTKEVEDANTGLAKDECSN